MNASPSQGGWLTGILLEGARSGAEWILWLLLLLSLLTLGVFLERMWFLHRHRQDTSALRLALSERLGAGDVAGAVELLQGKETMEARVLVYGLAQAHRGPEAVASLCRGALGHERLRYERGTPLLATVGSNAPFIGLLGTVMGVILAFDQLSLNAQVAPDASSAVMGAIAEALVATGVGLLVAIPAIIFFNLLKTRVKERVTETGLLAETAVALLRTEQGD